jgi:hypothetical protein
MIIKDTENSTRQSAWFAVEDINRRAAAAYNAHIDLFESDVHCARVEAVKSIMREYFAGWAAIYETARAQTARRAAHTEVKFNRVVMNRKRRREDFLAALAAVGIDAADVVYKPATESCSVHVK